MDEEEAAIKIEALQRGRRDRARVEEMRRQKEAMMNSGLTEEQAAIKIEALHRGRRDRARVAELRAQQMAMMDQGMTEEEAATRIEAIQRGRRDRARVADLRRQKEEVTKEQAATRIEAIQRGRRDRARVAAMRQAKREQEEEEARRQEEEAEMQRLVQEEEEAREEEARLAAEQKRKKKKKGLTAELGENHKVHPDDVELCEPRDVGSRVMLRNLHIGTRKVRCNCCSACMCMHAFVYVDAFCVRVRMDLFCVHVHAQTPRRCSTPRPVLYLHSPLLSPTLASLTSRFCCVPAARVPSRVHAREDR